MTQTYAAFNAKNNPELTGYIYTVVELVLRSCTQIASLTVYMVYIYRTALQIMYDEVLQNTARNGTRAVGEAPV